MLEMRKIGIGLCSQLLFRINGVMLFSEGFKLLLFFRVANKKRVDNSGIYLCLRCDFESVVLGKVVEVQLSPEEETRPQGQPSYRLPPLTKFRAALIYLCILQMY